VLDDLFEELTQKIQAGEPIDVEAYVRRHPEQADAIRSLVPALAVLEDLGRSAPGDAGTWRGGTSGQLEFEPGVLGDYRILRELGRGGMGVVYEAMQISLRRAVALKVLPFAAALSPQHIARFLREAQAAAQLHHSNIVPVFAVGNERGVYYYAMQYIEGKTLAALIDELRAQPRPIVRGGSKMPRSDVKTGTSFADDLASGGFERNEPAPVPATTPEPTASPPAETGWAGSSSNRGRVFFRTIADLGRQCALALHYAHSVGILHRDIKPANLMVDSRGNLWVADFGLARFGDDPSLSMSGDLVGTVRYMSPEQAQGLPTAIDQRTDVYGLGVTLYELLTLQPAFEGNDRQTILRQIIHEEPRPPRKKNQAIPRELETIVLKAMAKDPEARYQTAQAIGADLKRFLDDLPIVARRPTVLERARMWVRRNPQWVSAAIVILAITVVILGGTVFWIARERAEALRQEGIASQQRDNAEAQRRLARQAVDEMYTQVAEKWLPYEPRMEPIRRMFLERALRFYEMRVGENHRDPAAREEAARAYRRIGSINSLLGQPDLAEPAFRHAVTMFERLAAESPGIHRYQLERLDSELGLARVLNKAKRTKEAEDIYRRTLAICQKSADENPHQPEFRNVLALASFDLADLLREAARLGEAELFYGKALVLQEQLAAEFPGMPDYRRDLARSLSNRAIVYLTLGRLEDAEQGFRRASDTIQKLAALVPAEPADRNVLAKADGNLGKTLYDAGRLTEAEPPLRRAIDLNTKLAEDFPTIPGYREDRAIQNHTLGNVLLALGRLQAAEESFRQSFAILEKLSVDHPSVPNYRMQLASCEIDFGICLATAGRMAESEQRFRRALAESEKLATQFPGLSSYRSDMGTALNNLAVLMYQLGKLTDAHQFVEAAIGHHDAALKSSSGNPEYLGQLRSDYELQAEILVALGQYAKAREAADKAIGLLPNQWQSHYHIAAIFARCAAKLETDRKEAHIERKKLAESFADRAIANLRQAVRLGFKDVKLLKKEADFEVLRERDSFKTLLRDWEAKK
jgi:serine/threonine protein kinase